MKGREYTKRDMARMQEALAVLTAYDMGTETNEFKEYVELLQTTHPRLKDSLAQLAWLLLRSFVETSGVDKHEVLQWYGKKFALATLEDET